MSRAELKVPSCGIRAASSATQPLVNSLVQPNEVAHLSRGVGRAVGLVVDVGLFVGHARDRRAFAYAAGIPAHDVVVLEHRLGEQHLGKLGVADPRDAGAARVDEERTKLLVLVVRRDASAERGQSRQHLGLR